MCVCVCVCVCEEKAHGQHAEKQLSRSGRLIKPNRFGWVMVINPIDRVVKVVKTSHAP